MLDLDLDLLATLARPGCTSCQGAGFVAEHEDCGVSGSDRATGLYLPCACIACPALSGTSDMLIPYGA
jgi:hypothetical protein